MLHEEHMTSNYTEMSFTLRLSSTALTVTTIPTIDKDNLTFDQVVLLCVDDVPTQMNCGEIENCRRRQTDGLILVSFF